jgi:hypothetical protein
MAIPDFALGRDSGSLQYVVMKALSPISIFALRMKGADAPLFVEAFLDLIQPLCSNLREFFIIPSNSVFNSDVLSLMTTLCLVVKEVKISGDHSGVLLVRCVAMLQALLESGKIAGQQSARYLDFGQLISAVESTGNPTWETLQGLMTLMTLLMKYCPKATQMTRAHSPFGTRCSKKSSTPSRRSATPPSGTPRSQT